MEKFEICIIEDNKFYTEFIREILYQEGFHDILTLSSVEEVINEKYNLPQIIILDLTLNSSSDGMFLLDQLKLNDNKSHEVIILSSQKELSVVITTLKKGALTFVPKDSNVKRNLLRAIRKVTSKKKSFLDRFRFRFRKRKLDKNKNPIRLEFGILIKLLLGFFIIINCSCATQNLFETEKEGSIIDLISLDSNFQEKIVTDNKLSISIWNHEDMSIGSIFSIYNSNKESGKWTLVDKNGTIKLPEIGRVHLSGLTVSEASDTLEKLYSPYLKDPEITVKVLNRKITVVGEVNSAGTFSLDNERNTLMQVIGMAQGFDTYANLEEIQVIRDSVVYKINLTVHSPELLHNILIVSDDIINVPARKGKMLDQRASTLIPYATAATALAIIVSVLVK